MCGVSGPVILTYIPTLKIHGSIKPYIELTVVLIREKVEAICVEVSYRSSNTFVHILF